MRHACGVRRRGGMPEIVDSDRWAGWSTTPSPTSLALALLDALALAEAPGTAAACRTRAEWFSRDRCVAEYEALSLELLGRDG